MALLKGYLYIAADEKRQFGKIGMTRDVHSKFIQLQINCPLKLELLGYHLCTYVRLREAHIHRTLKDLHIRNDWFRWDEKRINKIVEEALAISDEELKMILSGLPSQRYSFPVKRVDTGEVFLNASEAAFTVLGSRKLASKIRLAVRTGCRCGPTTWIKA